MSASSPSGAAAVSAAGISGFSPVGTVCACADATPKPAASITSIARLYRVLEIMTPPAYFRREDACTSARNCGGGGSPHFEGERGQTNQTPFSPPRVVSSRRTHRGVSARFGLSAQDTAPPPPLPPVHAAGRHPL